MRLNRRQFVEYSTQLLTTASALAAVQTFGVDAPGAVLSGVNTSETTEPASGKNQDNGTRKKIIEITPETADELQQALHRHTHSHSILRLLRGSVIRCHVREERVGGEVSPHPLRIPEGVELDLNASTLLLDLKSNSYGVRLSNDSTIRNGTIRVISSENKGSQACWHSGISVGAAYGDGGTPKRPGYFSTVRNWAIEGITIDQPFAAAAIQLMSEACHGTIRNVRILDSAKALLGIGMDWGSVGPMTSEDKEIPRMRKLWEQGEIFSTHPHDIQIEGVQIGKLTRNVDGNDAGVRCSACHNISIRDIVIEEAATAVAIFGGDLGYEFARQDQRTAAHQGYVIEKVKISKALKYGVVLNGAADNVWRATRSEQYQAVRDPVVPGLDRPVLRQLELCGPGEDSLAQGIYAVSVSQATLDNLHLSHFNMGVHVEDWVNGMTFRRTQFHRNKEDKRIEGATVPATGVQFSD